MTEGRSGGWIRGVAVLAVLVAMLALPASSSGYIAQLKRYPYLTDLVGTSVMVNWGTDRSSINGAVKWGKVGTESCTAHTTVATRTGITVNSVSEYQWTAPVTGLQANTQYCYRVYFGAGFTTDLLGADTSPTFKTQLATGDTTPFKFAVFGDWGKVDSAGRTPTRPTSCPRSRRAAPASPSRRVTTHTTSAARRTMATSTRSARPRAPCSARTSGRCRARRCRSSRRSATTTTTTPCCSPTGRSRHRRRLLWRALHDRDLLLPERHAVDGLPERLVRVRRRNARFYVLDAAWDDSNAGTADVYKNDYDNHWRPDHAAVPVARERPRDAPAPAQIRLLALPDVLGQPGRGLRLLSARRELARGPSEALRRDPRLQRPRALLPAIQRARRGASRPMRRVAAARASTRSGPEREAAARSTRTESAGATRRTSEAPAAAHRSPSTRDRVHHFLLVNVNGSHGDRHAHRRAGQDLRPGHLHRAAAATPTSRSRRPTRPTPCSPASFSPTRSRSTTAVPRPRSATQLTDTLPAGVTFDSATPSQGSCAQARGHGQLLARHDRLRRERDRPDQGQAPGRRLDHEPGERQLERRRLQLRQQLGERLARP